DRLIKYITFNHLPKKATIRIFNLAGVLVKTINKDDDSQFARWNLRNEHNLPVASGVYIVHIDMPEIGATKILKLLIVQEEEIIPTY
ncbi:Por secretion system C-terminal sorting domain-containing protein, partial [Candidatus Kryptonium thompsonii]